MTRAEMCLRCFDVKSHDANAPSASVIARAIVYLCAERAAVTRLVQVPVRRVAESVIAFSTTARRRWGANSSMNAYMNPRR